jgi:hypothetical protein
MSNPILRAIPKQAALKIVRATQHGTDYSIVVNHSKKAVSVVKHPTGADREYKLVAHRIYKRFPEPKSLLDKMLLDAAKAIGAAYIPFLLIEEPVLAVYRSRIEEILSKNHKCKIEPY